MAKTQCSWLVHHTMLSKDNATPEVCDSLVKLCEADIGSKVNPANFGRLIMNAIGTKRERVHVPCSSDRQATIYSGLKYRQNSCTCYQGTAVAPSYQVVKQNVMSIIPNARVSEEPTDILIQLKSDMTLNGLPIFKDIIISTVTSTFKICVGTRTVDLQSILLDNTFPSDTNCMQTLFNIINNISLCCGKPKLGDTVVRSIQVEKCQISSNSPNYILRSPNCNRVLTFHMGNSTQSCTVCRNITVKYSRDKNYLKVDPSDSKDVQDIIDQVMPNASNATKKIFHEQQQHQMLNDPRGHKWDQATISVALGLWCQNPKSYETLNNSGFIKLPSGRTLQHYKAKASNDTGLNPDIINWMLQQAKQQQQPQSAYTGGILIDEMSIQEDLICVRQGSHLKLVGFVDMGREAMDLKIMSSKSSEEALASYVLQFTYLGLNGFRWPLAHFPSKQATAEELHILLWKLITFLEVYTFTIIYCSLDGAITNRQLIDINFTEMNPLTENFKIPSPKNPFRQYLIFIMDMKHCLKKIRNGILASRSSGNRTLSWKNCPIVWDQFVDTYNFDKCNSLDINRKLTDKHIHLDNASKMRNHLAEEVLDRHFLEVMLQYKSTLGNGSEALNGPIELLQQTSVLVTIFCEDKRPIKSLTDDRIVALKSVSEWFLSWEESEKTAGGLWRQRLLSDETRFDLQSAVLGFIQLCKERFTTSPQSSIMATYINSDPIENHFCQVRATHNGANTNPNYQQYKSTQNAIILGQSTLSKKRNSGKHVVKSKAATPYARPPLKTLTNSPVKNVAHQPQGEANTVTSK